ncbi:GGDEF domain-containing protein [Kineococcus gypseus]|uniref:GGDEF domain-containing protein n=1 Tax=Kineococcus gypseus TaxID=1637102 RepID=UPI003D7D43C5
MQHEDYRRLVEDSPIAILLVVDGTVRWVNASARRLLAAGSAQADPVGGALEDLVHPDDRANLREGLAAAQRAEPGEGVPLAEWRFVRPAATAVTVEVVASPVLLEGEAALALACWDVSQHVERLRDLAHRATHDRLTGLPNRSLFEDRWSQARSRARRTGVAPAVAFCDVDDLKAVNDLHGHLVGDAVLVAVAQRLSAAAREEDTVARYGGDEFVVLLEGPAETDPTALEERFRRAVSGVAVDVPGRGAVSVRCSLGLVVDEPGDPAAEVLARADARMYRDKRTARD